ncbi:RNA polymerase sigma-70 factor [Pedobacter miscanthi]|uniref:RNA polymerase sigma-70 factor n=1 Tax=Pedobacter miscanthi TaxID=2259170 RepID=UPI00292F1DE4|nr:RNA polymerase sigma-70 factor [Pedobacter miscanthi]
MVKNYSDQQLVELLQNGDEQAMAEIYDRYWQKLLAVAYKHSRDKSAAKDIVQDIMIKLWDRHEGVQISSLSAYLGTAVKYSVFSYLVRERRRNEIADQLGAHNDRDKGDEEIYAQFLKEYIDGIVEALPEKCRLVFKTSRAGGKNIPQIATELNISEKTVEAHLTKALRTIKYSLRKSGIITSLFIYLWLK